MSHRFVNIICLRDVYKLNPPKYAQTNKWHHLIDFEE